MGEHLNRSGKMLKQTSSFVLTSLGRFNVPQRVRLASLARCGRAGSLFEHLAALRGANTKNERVCLVACVCKVGVLYRRGLFVVIFRSEECDAARTRKRPEDPSETRKEHQALEGPHQNAARRSRQDQAKIKSPRSAFCSLPLNHTYTVSFYCPGCMWNTCSRARHGATIFVI